MAHNVMSGEAEKPGSGEEKNRGKDKKL